MKFLSFFVLFQVISSIKYSGNIWDFDGINSAKQIIYGTISEGLFGNSINCYGDRIAIGEINNNNNKGQVNIYTHIDEDGNDVGGWYLESTLIDEYGNENDQFGYSVGMYSTIVVVGANRKDYNNYQDSGSAFLYEIHLNEEYRYQWNFIQELTRDDAEPQDYFGHSVAIYGNTTIVGCYGCDTLGTMSGAVYIYAKYYSLSDDGKETYEWAYHHTLTPPSGRRYDWFGTSLAIHKDVIVVGATGLDDPVSLQGKTGGAYVFDIVPDDTYADGIGWKVFAELSPGDGQTGDGFGTSVTVYDGVVAISSPYSYTGSYQSGAVYVYHKDDDDNWFFYNKLTPVNPNSKLHFGYSVALYKDILLVGSLNETGLSTVYIYGKEYDITNSENIRWDLVYELQPITEIIGDKFGSVVAVFESLIAIGSPLASSPWQDYSNNGNSNNNNNNNKNNNNNQRLYTNGAVHIYWATDRINIDYISKDIKVYSQVDSNSPHVTTGGLIISSLGGILIAGYIYYAFAAYLVKLEEQELEKQEKLRKQQHHHHHHQQQQLGNNKKDNYFQTSLDSQHGDSESGLSNTIDISTRESLNSTHCETNFDESNHSKNNNQELLRASLARLSTRSSHGVNNNNNNHHNNNNNMIIPSSSSLSNTFPFPSSNIG